MSLVELSLNLLFPPRCPFCRKILSGTYTPEALFPPWVKGESMSGVLCRECATKLVWLKNSCPRCARELEGATKCSCRRYEYAFDNCTAVGRYTGELREALHYLKYRRKRWLSRPLGRLLSWKLSSLEWVLSVDGIVPVPLSRRRQAGRGYNQAALLAAVAGRELQIPVLEGLERIRDTESQTGMDLQQRWQNLRGAFRCREDLTVKNAHLLLIDDVLTTGATAHEAAATLKKAGAAGQVSVAVLAR